jgi:hypothetical protein
MPNKGKELLILKHDEVSFVVQGPEVFLHGENVTKNLINEINSFFPKYDVIFSTWETHVDTYVNCRVINNVDPGIVNHNRSKFLLNVERQRLSTIAGINCVNSAYVFKIRSDALVKGSDFDVDAILKILKACSRSKICLFYYTCPTNLNMVDDRVQFGPTNLMLEFWSFDYKKILKKVNKLFDKKKPFSRYYIFNMNDNMNLSPEQLMFISYCNFPLKGSSVYGMYFNYCSGMQKNFLLMESCKWGVLSTKWKMSNTLSSRLYIYMNNKKSLVLLNTLLFIVIESMRIFRAFIRNR